MLAYCLNNPVNCFDLTGRDAASIAASWGTSMCWLHLVDGPIPIGDIIYWVVLGVITLCGIDAISESLPQIYTEATEPTEPTVETPDVQYPGDDPTVAPEGTEWKGKGEQGSAQGNYHNSETGESWHPDLDHPEPIGPHWDYRDPTGTWWRVGAGNVVLPK